MYRDLTMHNFGVTLRAFTENAELIIFFMKVQ